MDINVYLELLWKSITFDFLIKFIIVYFFIIWISLVVWVLKDIRNRTSNVFFQLISVLISVIPFVGIFFYLLIRPSRTLYEKYYEEIEENLDIINEIIEERKKKFEEKINKSIEKEASKVNKKLPIKNKKTKYTYEVNFIDSKKSESIDSSEKIIEKEEKSKKNETETQNKKEIRVTQIKKRNF